MSALRIVRDGVERDMTEAEAAEFAATLPTPVVPVDPPLTARQLRLGLLGLGVTRTQVEAAIAGIEDAAAREAASIEWEYSSVYERDHPLIGMVGGMLGLTDAQIDAAWSAAATL